MDRLDQTIRAARRRLLLQRFLRLLPWFVSVALLVSVGVIGAGKIWPLSVVWWVWMVAAVLIGTVIAGLYAVWTRSTSLDAALEIDHRFGLKERVSSAWSLDVAIRQTEAGQAVIDDAARHLRRLDLRERFRLRASRWTWLPLAPAAVALLVALLIGPLGSTGQATAQTDTPQEKQVRRSTDQLRRKLLERRKRAAQEGLADAEDLFKRLEQRTEELARRKKVDPKKTLIKLNNLARQLQERRKALGGAKQIKQQLSQLKNLDRGPADKFARAMKQGDFKQAIQELDKLKQQIAQGKLTDEQKKKLARQLDQMREKLEQLAKTQEARKDQLRQQIAEARAAGRTEEAAELESQLNEMLQQASQQESMNQLAKQLRQCAKSMEQNDLAQALDQLEMTRHQLDRIDRQLQELELLDEASDQIAQCKGQCAGGRFGKRGNGQGLGVGHGRGPRPEADGDTSAYDTRVRQKVGRGTATITDLVDGPNVKGRIQKEIASEFKSVLRGEADPITTQRLPREYREQTKSYFDGLLKDD